ncbi:uncharacterized protein LOC124815498 [Hydra vulgaris]|uniref:uncharacterized protein LOC124815498 n=1 Tax=Hydra vulgaris TaxID=6087 RepID=UPI0032EA10AE
MVDKSEVGNNFSESTLRLRTPEIHEYHLAAIIDNAANKNVYGVSKKCDFLELDNFDVLTAFPPDIMHDLFEGIMPVTLKCVIKHLLRSCNTLSVNNINDSINKIHLINSSNRPSQLPKNIASDKAHINGTAVQKLELFLLFPQLVGNDVPHGNIGWEVFLILREILFGSEYIIPKMHYPRLIRLFGLLRNFWCLRFESKHQYFKKAASNGRCFKNITKTLSKRHQMLQCWEMLTNDMLLSNYTVSGNAPRFFHNLDVKVQEAIRLLLNLDIEGNEFIVIAKSISVMSKVYHVKNVYFGYCSQADCCKIIYHSMYSCNFSY